MTLEFVGDWPDRREQIQVAVNLLWIERKSDVWEISLVTGDQALLTLDPELPLQVQLSGSLKVMSPSEMHVRPRYLVRRKDSEWIALCASNDIELVFVMIIYYSLGEQALSDLVKVAMPPMTASA